MRPGGMDLKGKSAFPIPACGAARPHLEGSQSRHGRARPGHPRGAPRELIDKTRFYVTLVHMESESPPRILAGATRLFGATHSLIGAMALIFKTQRESLSAARGQLCRAAHLLINR